MQQSIQSIIDKTSLKWIFVGGKGGVGKTTTSSALALKLSESREKVLLISTDPAHNLSDAFNQQLCDKPTLIKGTNNLFAMELQSSLDMGDDEKLDATFTKLGLNLQSGFIKDVVSNLPGIDEAVAFGELIKTIDSIENCTVVFDTAPTGHTLRFLKFPSTLEKLLAKLLELKTQFEPMLKMATMAMASQNPGMQNVNLDDAFEKVNAYKVYAERANEHFRDHDKTTFVAVCIPEFLSLYETERLVQELENQDMNIENIVVNQLISLEIQDYDKMIVEVEGSSLTQNVKDVTLKSLFRCKMQQK